MPKVIILAGANGSGKSTLAESLIDKETKSINADFIRDSENISPIAAGKKAISLINDCAKKKKDYAFETTMPGLTLQNTFQLLKKYNYHIVIYYLFVYPQELLVERIKERIKKGGHFAARADVLRRYYRSVRNFWKIYKNYAGEWEILNNNESHYKDIAIGQKGNVEILDNKEFGIFMEALKNAGK